MTASIRGVPRREFLKTSGSLVVTFSLGDGRADAARSPCAAQKRGKSVAPDRVDGFLAIGADGSVTVFSGKVDLGTRIRTAMTQIAAAELSVSLDHVEVVQNQPRLGKAIPFSPSPTCRKSRATVERRRADGCSGALGDRERYLPRAGVAATLDTVYARQSAGRS
jgi:hypothetical protein